MDTSLNTNSSVNRILLVDDQALLLDVLSLVISQQPDMEVVGTGPSVAEAVACAKERGPHLAVIGVSMPDGGGPEATRIIVRDCPGVRVLALSRHSNQGIVRKMLAAGASGYVGKRASADTLCHAIRTVASGGMFLDPSVAGDLIANVVSQGASASHRRHAAGVLSGREEMVLRNIAWGKSNKEAAACLGISVKTAEGYRATGLAKLQMRSRSQILQYAIKQGWFADEGAFD